MPIPITFFKSKISAVAFDLRITFLKLSDDSPIANMDVNIYPIDEPYYPNPANKIPFGLTNSSGIVLGNLPGTYYSNGRVEFSYELNNSGNIYGSLTAAKPFSGTIDVTIKLNI